MPKRPARPLAEAALTAAVAALYEAAADPAAWAPALERLAAPFDGSVASVFLLERARDVDWHAVAVDFGDPWAPGYGAFVGSAPEVARTSVRDCVPRDAISTPLLRLAAAEGGPVARSRAAFVDDRTFARSAVCHEIAAPHGYFHTLGIGGVAADGLGIVRLSVSRPRRAGPFTGAEVGWAQRLAPHLARARDLRRRWRGLMAADAGRAAALDAVAAPCVAVDAALRVQWASAAGARLLGHADGLRVRHGLLSAADALADACLREAVRRCTRIGAGTDGAGGQTVRVPRGPAAPPLAVRVLPLRTPAGRGSDAAPALAGALRMPGRQGSVPTGALLVFDDAGPASRGAWRPPNAQPTTSAAPDAARRRAALTEREREVAVLLAGRRTNREVARALGIAEHTARHHTESVLRKLGVRSRRDVDRS